MKGKHMEFKKITLIEDNNSNKAVIEDCNMTVFIEQPSGVRSFIISKIDKQFNEKRIVCKGNVLDCVRIDDSIHFNALIDTGRYQNLFKHQKLTVVLLIAKI